MKHNLSDDALRKLAHADWLVQFAVSLQMTREKRGAPMTPFILGAISRLQMAADYIRLIERDLVEAQVANDAEPVTPEKVEFNEHEH